MNKKAKPDIECAWLTWRDCIAGKDRNSIFQQIYTMVWDATVYRLVLESRRAILDEVPHDPPLNIAFQTFIDRCFFYSQVASIRRLIDKSGGLMGRKGVFSLSALIKDIASYQIDLTREKYFQLRHMPYDYSSMHELQRDYINSQAQKNDKEAFCIPPELDWERVEEAHVSFDQLSGKTYSTRSHHDTVREQVFSRLHVKLENCDTITKYVDKFVAHSATPLSRSLDNIMGTGITFKHIWDAHRTIYEVAEFISTFLYSESHIPLALEVPHVLFHNWMISFQGNQDIDRLTKIFNEYRKETDEWRLDGVDQLWKLLAL